MFNKFVLFSFFCFAVVCADAQTIKTPQPSPTQTLKQDFGISSIDLIYSRPGMKGRKIFGDLVPYGKIIVNAQEHICQEQDGHHF